MKRPRLSDEHLAARDEELRNRAPGNGLWVLYLVLAVVTVISAVVTILMQGHPLVEQFGPNMTTESGAILITLVFVQRVLDRQERTRRLRASIGALRRGSRALTGMCTIWGDLVRGGMRRLPASRPRTIGELLLPHITEALADLDPSRERPAQDGASEAWVRWAARELAAAQQSLAQIVAAYGDSLDPEYVEAVDELVDDPFIQRFIRLAEERTDAAGWKVALNTARAHRDAYFRRLVRSVQLHNALAREAAKVRTRAIAPRTGALGFELPLDQDLVVSCDLGTEWWKATPAPGTLCAGLTLPPPPVVLGPSSTPREEPGLLPFSRPAGR